MPIIQDPRMNPRRESILGIAYIEESFILKGVTYESGHYFYKKVGPNNPEQDFNIRYLPHGFPIVVIDTTEAELEDWDGVDVAYYRNMFPNLRYDRKVVLKVEADPGFIEDPTTNLDRLRPMVAYMNRYASSVDKGLRKFNRGNLYNYNRASDELELDQ